MKPKFTFLLILAILLTQSCSTYLTHFENVSNTKESYNKILVVGRSKDNTARAAFENAVVNELAARGYTGVASFKNPQVLDITREYSDSELATIKANLLSAGYDGVIVTHLVSAEDYTEVLPGSVNTTYIPTRVGRFGRYISFYPYTTWEPDDYVSGVRYVFESSLFRLDANTTENMQWVGRFEFKDPMDIRKTVDKYAKELVGSLAENNMTR
ncbi:hypothetical protein [Robiginitalea myxolifaciens]|nr:hypothetical protein [Robiginitalea myxolifaciens]